MTLLYLIIAILVLAFIIFFHELGHYSMGKLLGFRILDFSIGFGPALLKFKKGETNYAIRAIPFGGACQFDGEDEDEQDDPRRFNAQPVWKRFLVIFAGPFMNVLLAFLIAFAALLFTPVPVYTIDEATGDYIPEINSVTEGSAADNAGILPNDIVIAVGGESPMVEDSESSIDALITLIKNAGVDFVITVERDGNRIDLPITNAYNEELGYNQIGVTVGALTKTQTHNTVGKAFTGSFDYLTNIVEATAKGIAGMFKNGIKQGDVSGVVGTVAIMVDVANENAINIVYIAIILSLSLGVFNLIPFPALDGGRLIFLIIEAIIRKPLNRKIESIVNAVGFALLLGLMIVVTISDVIGLFK